ncbi:NUDIX hydrolase [Auraticoccus cholistanensis]|uniref:NUDIX hydrolase n=1 Tax=Auraticoccus cholistanensis TaxID=2656650 RepID=UPI0018D1FBD6
MVGDEVWRERFPALYAEAYVDYADCRTRYTTADVADELVSRLHLVATTPEGLVVVCRSVRGWRFLPGGTREPDESLLELARRELREEAGAELTGDLRLFAAHVADSNRSSPYRPHLPHPRALWAYATAEVRLVGAPTNPDHGEVVVQVLTLPVTDAVTYLEATDPVHADVLRHAHAMGLVPPPRS